MQYVLMKGQCCRSTEFIYDLQKLNGNLGSTKFDTFWEELALYIEESIPAVDDRWYSDVPHLPFAISLHHLLNIVKIRIEQRYSDHKNNLQLPSIEWLQLQFWPRNLYSPSALQHTGRIDLKFGVQVRHLNQDHVVSHYISVLLQYSKNFLYSREILQHTY